MGKFPYAVHIDTKEPIYSDKLTKEVYLARYYQKLCCPFKGCPAVLKFVPKQTGNFFWSITIAAHSKECPYKTGYILRQPNEYNDGMNQTLSVAHITRSLNYALRTYFFRRPKSKPGTKFPGQPTFSKPAYLHFAYANEIDDTYSGKQCNVGGIIRAVMLNNDDPSNRYNYIRFDVRGKYDIDAEFDHDFMSKYPWIFEKLCKIKKGKMDKQEDEDMVFICIGTVRVERTAIRVMVNDSDSFICETGKKDANLLRRKYFLPE